MNKGDLIEKIVSEVNILLRGLVEDSTAVRITDLHDPQIQPCR